MQSSKAKKANVKQKAKLNGYRNYKNPQWVVLFKKSRFFFTDFPPSLFKNKSNLKIVQNISSVTLLTHFWPTVYNSFALFKLYQIHSYCKTDTITELWTLMTRNQSVKIQLFLTRARFLMLIWTTWTKFYFSRCHLCNATIYDVKVGGWSVRLSVLFFIVLKNLFSEMLRLTDFPNCNKGYAEDISVRRLHVLLLPAHFSFNSKRSRLHGVKNS